MSVQDLLQNIQEGTAESEVRRDIYNDMASTAISNAMMKRVAASRSASGGRGGPSNNDGGSNKGGNVKLGPVKGRRGAFLQSIATQESGGNYSAVGVDTGGGHRAYGKYQIMDFNFAGKGGWDKEALGRDISIQKFLNTPRIQEKIARSKLTDYFRQYGARGAAKAWYAGPGNAYTNSDAPQYGGPSINDYANEVVRRMRDILRSRR